MSLARRRLPMRPGRKLGGGLDALGGGGASGGRPAIFARGWVAAAETWDVLCHDRAIRQALATDRGRLPGRMETRARGLCEGLPGINRPLAGRAAVPEGPDPGEDGHGKMDAIQGRLHVA